MLTQRCLIGRSRACTIQLTEPDVSGEHALLRWTGSVWELQDLNSRNGTFVDGRRLGSGERIALPRGSTLGFARPQNFILSDAGAPAMFAVPLGSTAVVEAQGGILALPGPSTPEVMVFRGPSGWVVERGGEATPVADGEVLRVAGGAWQLHLPEPLPRTIDSTASPLDLDSITLRFHVSRDEEYIEVVAIHGPRMIDLKARSHHYILLTLARARLRDHALPPERQGWVRQDELLDMLRIDASHLHLSIYRLRQQFGEAGIVGPARIVERRPGTRQLRIGVARLEVEVLDGK